MSNASRTPPAQPKAASPAPLRLNVPLPASVALMVAAVLLCKWSIDDYWAPNSTGPYSPESVNQYQDPNFSPVAWEVHTVVVSGLGMAALRLALNRWLPSDDDASSIVAILFSCFLVPIGAASLYDVCVRVCWRMAGLDGAGRFGWEGRATLAVA
jgi:hypothetical protein